MVFGAALGAYALGDFMRDTDPEKPFAIILILGFLISLAWATVK